MKPRWLEDDRTIKGDRIGYTLIAKWRPWLYYRVITFRIDGGSPIQRMVSSMDTGLPPDSAPKRPDSFATVAVRCNRYGVASPGRPPVFDKEFRANNAEDSQHPFRARQRFQSFIGRAPTHGHDALDEDCCCCRSRCWSASIAPEVHGLNYPTFSV